MKEIINPPLPLTPTIFVIEEDNDARPSLTKNLREFGYRLLVAANIEDAFQWVQGRDYIHADLILIDLMGKPPRETLDIGRSLRAAAGYQAETPLVVMPERVAPDMQGLDKNIIASDWICYYEDADQLHRLIVRLMLP